jgi:hypothetical protein
MKFNNIKRLLRQQVENGVNTFWIYNEENKEFINIYKIYSDKLTIYTPQQLIEYLDAKEKE